MVFTLQLEYEGIPVCIDHNIDECWEHLPADHAVLQNEGIENIIRSRFMPWFKTDEFQDSDDDMIYQIRPSKFGGSFNVKPNHLTHISTSSPNPSNRIIFTPFFI